MFKQIQDICRQPISCLVRSCSMLPWIKFSMISSDFMFEACISFIYYTMTGFPTAWMKLGNKWVLYDHLMWAISHEHPWWPWSDDWGLVREYDALIMWLLKNSMRAYTQCCSFCSNGAHGPLIQTIGPLEIPKELSDLENHCHLICSHISPCVVQIASIGHSIN